MCTTCRFSRCGKVWKNTAHSSSPPEGKLNEGAGETKSWDETSERRAENTAWRARESTAHWAPGVILLCGCLGEERATDGRCWVDRQSCSVGGGPARCLCRGGGDRRRSAPPSTASRLVDQPGAGQQHLRVPIAPTAAA